MERTPATVSFHNKLNINHFNELFGFLVGTNDFLLKMIIEVKGHSGCQIDVTNEGNNIYVYKSTADPKYLKRLILQAEKQKAASSIEYQHIRVPKIFNIYKTEEKVTIKMQYIYSKNFIEFFEQAGFEQIDYLIGALKHYIEYEISQCQIKSVPSKIFQNKFAEIKAKCLMNAQYKFDSTIISILDESEKIFNNIEDIIIPIGICHGDLTFSNILFNGNNYYLIDFLDSFIETPLQDIVKIRQDTAFHWSQLMYTKRYDKVRLNIVFNKIDKELDTYFSSKYSWYREYYSTMQLMNMLRIIPYAHEKTVIEYLKNTIKTILSGFKRKDTKNKLNLNLKSINKGPVCKHTLIIPVAADKAEYANDLPYLFGLGKDGITICLKSILGMNYEQFNNIYFTILKKHEEKFFIKESLELQFNKLGITNAKVVILEEPTKDQAETIFKTIEKESIEGSIFIKDADSCFTTSYIGNNGVAIYPINELEILSPKDKSYASIDDMHYLTNIIEKVVIGHYISAGGYAFDNVDNFIYYYNIIRPYGRMCLSHIIYAMLLDNITFRPLLVKNYMDWGSYKLMNIF